MINMNKKTSIFRAYDVRGKYPEEINEEKAFGIGYALGSFLEGSKIVVGMDARKSSALLKKFLVKGLLRSGKKVIDIGISNTPMLYFAMTKWGFNGGAMITASHNPAEFNGVKMVKNEKGNILQIGEESGIKEIEKIFLKPIKPKKVKYQVEQRSILNEYIEELIGKINKKNGLRIVIDYGNGVGSISGKPFFEKTNFEIFSIFSEPKPDFPNHEPNPHVEENFKSLIKEVIKKKADMGIFFDGDADRAVPVNEKGEVMRGDVLIGILSLDILKDSKEKEIYYDLRCTKTLKEEIEKAGGIPIKMRVGNPYYKKKLIKRGGALGGETSGHIMYKEHYCIDDGLYAMIKLINIMQETGNSLSELEKPFMKYSKTYEINIEADNKEAKIKEIEKNYLKKDGKIEKIDGLTVEFEDWWFNVRPSNTENLLRLNLEAKTKELMLEKKEEVTKMILK
jgi:phosphomannomutase